MAASVPDYYAEKTLFITGGTGFIGKSLIEKLLRSCPDLKTIYILLRQKKGQGSEERLQELRNNKVFETLRQQNPDALQKLKLIIGDITSDGLGMSDDDRRKLQMECNIVFHSAAFTVTDHGPADLQQRLCANLMKQNNTTGTYRLLTLAETMEKLEAFVHLSTAYCRCELDVLEEKLYPAVHSPRNIMEIVKWMDDETLKLLEPKLISSEPNTYSYTKAITEDLVAEFSDKFPIAIARPSIVTASWKEPVPGWVDNLNGPTGLIIGGGKGVIRTVHCEPSYHVDAISVDVVANGCILIAYATGVDKSKKIQIYNLTLSGVAKFLWKEVIQLGEKWANEYPYTVALWYPGGSLKSYWISHQICLFLYHTIPAYVADLLLYLFGKKTFMVDLQKRITKSLEVLQYYTTKEWHFNNTNFLSLQKRFSENDRETFFIDLSALNASEYLKNYVLGTREFCCKEDASTLPRARKLHKIRYLIDRMFKLIFFSLVAWFLYSNSHIFTSSVELLYNTLKSIHPVGAVNIEGE